MTRGQVPGLSDRRLAAPPTEEGNPGLVQRCRKLPDLEARVALPPEQLGRLPQARGGQETVGTSPAQARPRSGRGGSMEPGARRGVLPGAEPGPRLTEETEGPAITCHDPPGPPTTGRGGCAQNTPRRPWGRTTPGNGR